MMRLSDCDKCSLSKTREQVSLVKGLRTASTHLIFTSAPKTNSDRNKLINFTEELKLYLGNDYFCSYVIKCVTNELVKIEHIKECRYWLDMEIKRVDAQLLVIMGNVPKVAVFGKLAPIIPENIFCQYRVGNNNKRAFIGSNVYGNNMTVKENLKRLINYIKEYYCES